MRQTAHGLRSRFHDMPACLPPAWAAVYRQVDRELSQYKTLTRKRMYRVGCLIQNRYNRCPQGLHEARRAYDTTLKLLEAYYLRLEYQARKRYQERLHV